jgi:O-antigen/teichoic acid export membrane protein
VKSFRARVVLVTGTSYLVSAFGLVSFIILANKLSQADFGQFVFILTVVLLVSDLCDFGTGTSFILQMRDTNREYLKMEQSKFLSIRLGTIILLAPIVFFAGTIIFDIAISFMFTTLVILTYVRNSIATVLRSEESYVNYLLLMSGEKFILIPLILISQSTFGILLWVSLLAIAAPIIFVYPSIFRIKPRISLSQTFKNFQAARMNGVASFVTNVALLFPVIIRFFCGDIAFSNYIFITKICSPIPTLGTSIALVNLSSKEKAFSAFKLKNLSNAVMLLCLIPLTYSLPYLVQKMTAGKYVYSYFNVITVLVIAIAYLLLHILVSEKLLLMHFSKIIAGYVVFTLMFVLLLAVIQPGLSLQLLLFCEFLAIAVALCYFTYQRMERNEEPRTN